MLRIPKPCVPTKNTPSSVYSLRGKVVEHSVKVSGWWIFKTKIPICIIQLNEEQVSIFNKIAQTTMLGYGGDERNYHKGIESLLKIGMPVEQLGEYAVGAEIGISFKYSGPLEQFFNGSETLRVIKFKVIDSDAILENEIQEKPPA